LRVATGCGSGRAGIGLNDRAADIAARIHIRFTHAGFEPREEHRGFDPTNASKIGGMCTSKSLGLSSGRSVVRVHRGCDITGPAAPWSSPRASTIWRAVLRCSALSDGSDLIRSITCPASFNSAKSRVSKGATCSSAALRASRASTRVRIGRGSQILAVESPDEENRRQSPAESRPSEQEAATRAC
jgi:hypothetical protein